MGERTWLPWLWLVLMAVTIVHCKQTPSLKRWDQMATLDKKKVNHDQMWLPKTNIATRESGGLNDGIHDATKKRLLEELHAHIEDVELDADPYIQTVKHERFLELRKSKMENLAKEKISKKSRPVKMQFQAKLREMMDNAVNNMKNNGDYKVFLKLEEQAGKALGKISKAKRQKRSADTFVPQTQDLDPSITAQEKSHKREKRFAEITASSLWPDGVIPYFFDADYPEEYKAEVLASMRIYEDMTPLHFTSNDSQLAAGLQHNSKLHFISSQPQLCWSYVGFHNMYDQYISCYQCGIKACIHEIGHALGLYHEQQSPERDRFERIYWQNIPASKAYNYEKVPVTDSYGNVVLSTFGRLDPDSVMHYDLNEQHPDWTVNHQPQIGVYDLDIEEKMEWNFNKMQHFYSLRDINEYYKPEADPCAAEGLTCMGDGYVTKVRGLTCKCICPQGLSGNCSELEQDDPELKTGSFPQNMALLKPLDGCPAGFHDDGSVMFKSGLIGTTDWPGPGMTYAGNNNWQMQLDFCVRDGSSLPNEQSWEPGDYCYIKTGTTCADGFTEGTVQWHDILSTASSMGTNFPSGTFSGESVIIEFCCRNDGYVAMPIRLPNNQPIVLFAHYMKACQEIEGMQSEMASFIFNNSVDGYDPTGDHPKIYKFLDIPVFEIYACYYTPLSYNDCGGIYNLDTNTPQQSLQTPNYPNNYPVNKRCSWIFHSPENTRLVLHFDHFDISGNVDSADDYVEIQNNLPGNMGVLYYGDHMHRSWVTYTNYLAVYLFSNGADSATGFSGTVKLITDSDNVYSGNGENYDGPRSYTRYYHPCISWAEAKLNNCTSDPFSEYDAFDILEGSYCRNPGGLVDFPYCFTHAQDGYCKVEFCDVSNLEPCYDIHSDCNQTVCSTDNRIYCAETCGECTARQAEIQNFPLACEPPSRSLGSYAPVKSSYAMGEQVLIKCNSTGEEVAQTCSTMGNWLPRIEYLCGAGENCLADELEYITEEGVKCLKVLTDVLYTYDDAKAACASQGAQLITEKDVTSSQSLANLASVLTYPFWLGLSDATNEGTFTWVDDSPLNYGDKWAAGEPYSYTPKWTGSNTFYASVNWTKGRDGTDCIPWIQMVGISQYAIDANFPVDGSVANAGSNCRDPSRDGNLWCYTSTSGSWRWCDLAKQAVPACAGETIIETAYYGTRITSYRGSVNTNINGQACWAWASPYINYPDSYFVETDGTAAEAGNKCRTLGKTEPWCWLFDYSAYQWVNDHCDVPEYCGGQGYRKTSTYSGTVSFTTYGYECLRWDYLATLSGFEWLTTSFSQLFPDENIAAAENYCRGSPWGLYSKPACYFESNGYIYAWYCPVYEEEEMQDCVVRDGNTGLWSDVYCDEMRFAVCERSAESERTSCVDHNANCASYFEEDPAVFIDNPSWAYARCARASGLCSETDPSQPNTEISCTDPNDGVNVAVVRTAASVAVGDYIEYECNAFHTLVDGNLKRGCTVNGTWTGTRPNCALTSDVGGWNNDLEIRDRYKLGPSNTVYLGNNQLMRIQYNAMVIGWRFFSYSPGQLELYVFRLNGQTNSFTVVGKTVITSSPDKRAQTVELGAADRFEVLGGDIIGWAFYSSSDGGIPYDKCKLEYTNGGNIYEKKTSIPLTVSSTYYFSVPTDDCRVYSISVNLGPLP